MKVISVVGARPNFCNKEMVINREFKKRGVDEVLVHTGQHYDNNLSKIFFDQLGIPEPNYHFNLTKGDQIKQTAEIITHMQDVIIKEDPDVVLVHGDVVSTLSASIAAVKLKKPVAHFEAGIRADNIYNPEEINRRVADVLSETLFAPVKSAYDNLIKENFKKENVFLTGDLVNDSIQYMVKNFNLDIKNKGYVLATIHREENVTVKERFEKILRAMSESGKEIIFPAHPRAKMNIERFGLTKYLEKGNIKLMEPQGYLEFLKLMCESDKVITDSGGVRREAFILGKPVIVPINIEWFPEIFESGWGKLTDDNEEEIKNSLINFDPRILGKEKPEIFGKGDASEKVVSILKERYEN